MKVSECEKCAHYKRCVYSNYYRPAGYHPIGMSHAYGYCTKHQDRCLNIKLCELHKKEEKNEA